MDLKPVAKLLFLLLVVHLYVFLTALTYHYLERKSSKITSKSHVGHVLDKHFYKAAVVNSAVRPIPVSQSKVAVVAELKLALEKDKHNEIRSAFSSLWKSYLFSLTTITTAGNSGLYLQEQGSQIFFVFTTAIGTILYCVLLHHIAVLLLGIFVQTVEYGFVRRQHDNESLGIYSPYHARVWVLVLSYIPTLSSVFIIAIAALISQHGYLFGLFAITDAILTVGNFHILATIHPWNEGGFVICVNLIFIMCHSFLYTTIFTTFKCMIGTKWEDFLSSYGPGEPLYKQLCQQDEEPYQNFLTGAIKRAEMDSDKEDVANTKAPNPFLDAESENSLDEGSRNDSIVPTLLAPEEHKIEDEN